MVDIEAFKRRVAREVALAGGGEGCVAAAARVEIEHALDRHPLTAQPSRQWANALAMSIEDRLAYDGNPLRDILLAEHVLSFPDEVHHALTKAWRYSEAAV